MTFVCPQCRHKKEQDQQYRLCIDCAEKRRAYVASDKPSRDKQMRGFSALSQSFLGKALR